MTKPTHKKAFQRKQKREEKLKKLRKKYQAVKEKRGKEKILEKVKKIAPWLSEEEFLKLK